MLWSLPRRELLARAGLAAAAVTLAGSSADAASAQPAPRPLRVLTMGLEWPRGMLEQAQLDLGFPLQLKLVNSTQQIEAVLSKPESFDVFAGYSHQVMRVWYAGHLRPIDTRRLTAWADLYKLFAWGKLVPGSASPYGVGDAPFRSLFLRTGTTGLPVSSARPPLTDEVVQWIDERTGRPHGGRPMPRYVVGVPAHFAAESMGYLRDVIPKAPARISWAELLNRSWQGRVAIQNDPAVALIDLGRAARSAGIIRIHNVGSMTIGEIDRLVKILAVYRQRGQFHAAWSSFNDSVNLVASKDVAITPLWPGAAARLAAEGVNVACAIPPEGYRGTCSTVGISKKVVGGRRLDKCYAYLDWLYGGSFGAQMMRQGYYAANGHRLPEWIGVYGKAFSRPFTAAEYAYWYEGRPAAHALPDVKGTLRTIRRGSRREGGSLAVRISRCTAWSSYFHAAEYQAKRFQEFVAA